MFLHQFMQSNLSNEKKVYPLKFNCFNFLITLYLLYFFSYFNFRHPLKKLYSI